VSHLRTDVIPLGARRAAPAAAWLMLSCLALPAPALAKDAEARADEAELREVMAKLLSTPAMSSARVGVMVSGLEDGKPLFSRNADELLNPASNVKLVTAAATLARLGPEYRFSTEFLSDAPLDPAKGRVGTLYVRGKGDPLLTTERLYAIAGQLFHAGVRQVDKIVVDASWFGDDPYPPGYEQDFGDHAYLAPTGALSLNWNTAAVYLRPGEGPGSKAHAAVEPASEYFVIEGAVRTGKSRQHRWRVKSEAAALRQKLLISGTVDRPDMVRRRISHPDLYFGYSLVELLKARGVKVKSVVRRGEVPGNARLLHVDFSPTFDVVLKVMNKYSQNFVAEQLLKTLGAEVKGAPGSTAKGVEVVEEFLAKEVGIPRGTYVIRNASGLNDANRMSAAQMTRILRHMGAGFATSAEYVSSVPIAGKDGTLRNRFSGSEAESHLRAKTGTLENVSALAGYVEARSGRRYAFTFMVNDFDWRKGGRRAVIGSMDSLGVAVAASGVSGDGSRVAKKATSKDPSLTRLKTYLALGSQRDARNLPFLRTAWRSETDPAVRAVIADALYQSSPDDYDLSQSLVDAYSAEANVFGRLLEVSRSESVPVPGLASIVELSARGNQDALRLLMSLTPVKGADADGELSRGLADVAQTAPDELLAALVPLSATERDGVTRLLAKGLGAHVPTHPLWAALKRDAAGSDAARAALARATESALATHLVSLQADPSKAVPAEGTKRAGSRPGG